MPDNFQVETFADKADRDARYTELGDREGLVKFSDVREIVGGGKMLPNYAGRLEFERTGKNTSIIVHGRLQLAFASTWSVAYPRTLSKLTRMHKHARATGPCPKKVRRARYFKRLALRHRVS